MAGSEDYEESAIQWKLVSGDVLRRTLSHPNDRANAQIH